MQQCSVGAKAEALLPGPSAAESDLLQVPSSLLLSAFISHKIRLRKCLTGHSAFQHVQFLDRFRNPKTRQFLHDSPIGKPDRLQVYASDVGLKQ